MKAYLVGGGMDGKEEYEGYYYLVTADGISWRSRWCSGFEQARRELYEQHEQLRRDLEEKYGNIKLVRLGEDAMTFDRLLFKEEAYAPVPKKQMADGLYYNLITIKNGQWHKGEPKPIEHLASALIKAITSQE